MSFYTVLSFVRRTNPMTTMSDKNLSCRLCFAIVIRMLSFHFQASSTSYHFSLRPIIIHCYIFSSIFTRYCYCYLISHSKSFVLLEMPRCECATEKNWIEYEQKNTKDFNCNSQARNPIVLITSTSKSTFQSSIFRLSGFMLTYWSTFIK